jgi:hypothetical protein
MSTLVKTTQDGRRLEVVGQAILLGGKLEAVELVPVEKHPNRRAILEVMPEAAFMAGRVALTAEEGRIAQDALEEGERQFLSDPRAIEERFRHAANRREAELGIE